MIKAIVFDVGGVLLRNRIEEVIENLAKNLKIDKEALNKLNKEHHQKMIRGDMPVLEFSAILKDKLHLDIDAEEIVKIWEASYLEVMPVNVELFSIIKKLKQGYMLGLISNIYDLHAEINTKRGLFLPFDAPILSCRVGLIKPERAVFSLVIEKLGLKASECVFIDDRTRYLDTPKKMGFSVIQYRSNEQLLKNLRELGIDA